ncbi:hypothetical protein GDO86_017976 [Hymenochirus boettgeri]|uniref:Uncharacterized protein n=1 Tax=Hymenochirus boettgeri TaxID=247094 RepID=A0A8T2ILA6_9PIPI|nr:hypothetical protein GDO86_017976 [Hymenochirus boettgeri]
MEYNSQGITVQSVLPLFVSTNMISPLKTNIFIKSPDSFAYDALNSVGYTTRTNGCLSHEIQSFLLHLVLTDFTLTSPTFNSMADKLDTRMKKRRQKVE